MDADITVYAAVTDGADRATSRNAANISIASDAGIGEGDVLHLIIVFADDRAIVRSVVGQNNSMVYADANLALIRIDRETIRRRRSEICIVAAYND